MNPLSYQYGTERALSQARLEQEIRDNAGITKALAGTSFDNGVLTIEFREDLPEAQRSILDTIIDDHSGLPVVEVEGQPVYFATDVPKTSTGLPRFAVEASDSEKFQVYSPDLTQKRSWYRNSKRHDAVELQAESLTSYVVPLVYKTGNFQDGDVSHPIVDLQSGLVNQEEFILDPQGRSYRVEVRVGQGFFDDATILVERDLQAANPDTHGDYIVDYDEHRVVFRVARDPADKVWMTFYEAWSSEFIIAPPPGMSLQLSQIEAQFSTDVVMNDTVVFDAEGYAAVFAPAEVAAGNLQPTDLVPVSPGGAFVYKTMRNFLADSYKSYPSYPPLGGTGWRGINADTVIFDWDYLYATPLIAEYGMRIRVYMKNHRPFGGTYASVTFYSGVRPSVLSS